MNQSTFVALERFELSQAEPESDVLPLHHKAIFQFVINSGGHRYDHFVFDVAKVGSFSELCKFFGRKFSKNFIFTSFLPILGRFYLAKSFSIAINRLKKIKKGSRTISRVMSSRDFSSGVCLTDRLPRRSQSFI